MTLYPTITLDPLTTVIGGNIVPAGSLVIMPIDMSAVLMRQIIVGQISQTEDFGMRGWVSLYPNGISLITGLNAVFPLMRMSPQPLVVYVQGQSPPLGSIQALVTPGLYYLNILNLTNTQSMFALAMATLA
jgi:hypothetical protein